jgi:hypothetical protein
MKKEPFSEYLQYIGKSNDRFTFNNLYVISYYSGQFTDKPVDENNFHVQVWTHKNVIVSFTKEHFNYFHKNFKFIEEKDLNKLQRKLKLNKISKINGKKH